MSAITAKMFLDAQRRGINAEREFEFAGETLKFYEKTPTANVLLLELTTDWCCRRVSVTESSNSLSHNDWEFEIVDTASLTAGIANKTAFMMIGSLKFKGVKRDTTAGNLGIWKFVTEMM